MGRQSVPRQGHNTPLPLKRSTAASFKRLLGGTSIWTLAAGRTAVSKDASQACQEAKEQRDRNKAIDH